MMTRRMTRNEDFDDANEPNKLKELNAPNEPNHPNVHHNVPYRYMNSSVSIANQELELPNSLAVISRSYLSRLVESDKLSRKLKVKIMNAKQYHSSPLG
jgi:hypothetical protein